MSPPRSLKSPRHSKLLRRSFLVGVLLIMSVFGGLGIFGEDGILELLKLKSFHAQLEQENRELVQKQEELRAEILRLKDPRYQKYLARERLGLLGENEMFIILDEEFDKAAALP